MPYAEIGWTNTSATPVNMTNLNHMDDGIATAQSTAESAYSLAASAGGGGGGTTTVSGALVGGVALDSFTGTTDDDKLGAALSYVAAQTVKPPIIFTNRRYDFVTPNRTAFSGMKLVGPYAHGNQQRAANSIPNDIRYTGGGVWWQLAAGNVFDVGLYGLSFQGNSNSQFMASGSSVLWTSVFRDLGFNLWKHVLGNPTTKFLMTANLFDGWWNTNNGYNTAYSLGGSDCNLWMDGMLMDSQPAFIADGAYHIRFDYLQKTTIGPLFITCEQNSGIYINGNNSQGPLVLHGQGRAEGRNPGQPCYGSNIRVDGGHLTLRDWWVAYGASNFAGSGHTGEGGLITVAGGRVLIDGVMTSRATGVAETVPFIYHTGGSLRVRNIITNDFGGTWTGLPRVQGVGGTRSLDDSVTLV
jgi:hypothetical protein